MLGTESCSVYILDPEAFTIMDSLSLPAPPVFLSVTGLYDVEYRIVVACRNGALCALKRGWQTARVICPLDSQPLGLIRREKSITVATMDNNLMALNNKGRKLWTVKQPSSITCIEKMDIPSRGLFLVAVALASNHVLIYNDKNVVDCFKMEDTVSAMKFGRFGREENTLVIVTIGGTLNMKILKRTAHFDDLEAASTPMTSQNLKLNIPKKTKLFVDQVRRIIMMMMKMMMMTRR